MPRPWTVSAFVGMLVKILRITDYSNKIHVLQALRQIHEIEGKKVLANSPCCAEKKNRHCVVLKFFQHVLHCCCCCVPVYLRDWLNGVSVCLSANTSLCLSIGLCLSIFLVGQSLSVKSSVFLCIFNIEPSFFLTNALHCAHCTH